MTRFQRFCLACVLAVLLSAAKDDLALWQQLVATSFLFTFVLFDGSEFGK